MTSDAFNIAASRCTWTDLTDRGVDGCAYEGEKNIWVSAESGGSSLLGLRVVVTGDRDDSPASVLGLDLEEPSLVGGLSHSSSRNEPHGTETLVPVLPSGRLEDSLDVCFARGLEMLIPKSSPLSAASNIRAM